MKLHDLAPPKGATTAKRRVGRGTGGKGHKTAGRGTKGQKARNTMPAGFEGGQLPLMQRIPKLKGFKNPFRVEYTPVNLAALDALGADEVTVEVAGRGRPGAPEGPRQGAWGRGRSAARSGSRRMPSPSRPRRPSPPPGVASNAWHCRSHTGARPRRATP